MSAIRLTGHLRGPARMYVDAAGAAWLMFSLECPSGAPVLVRKRVGTGYAAQHVATHNARALTRGTPCAVYAAGIERSCRAKLDALHAYAPSVGVDNPADHLLLLGVDWIDVPGRPLRAWSEPDEHEAALANLA